MLLYVCPTCGRWQDVAFTKALFDILANVSKSLNQPPPEQMGYPCEQMGYPCPAGHGLMVQVQPNDRLYVRAGVVEGDTPMLPE